MRGRTITLTVVDKRGKAAKTIPLYQYDYGQKLLIDGVELPEYYEVHFSNQQYGESVTVLGDSTGVLIPDEMVATGENIYVWLFLHDTSNDGETEYFGVIPVIKRAQPTDITPTPEEQNIITEVIAALNNMEDDMSEQVQAAEAAKEAAQTAQAGAESAATTASGYVDAVAAAQVAAEAAQAAAETAATSATTSATSATSSANSANNALSEATNAKIAAVDAANSASTSATSASTASGNAANSAVSAESARVDAVDAATAAGTAQTAAETAQGKAEDAQTAAETAQTGAETAQTAAETAQTAAETAQGKAEDAQAAAEGSAEDSEAYAVGTRGGVDVESDDPAYENNAKYYAEAMVGKADLVSDAVEGNFAGLDSEGNLTDSGSKPSDFLTEHQDISGKLDAPSTAGTQGQVLTSDGEGGQAWADPSGAIDDTAGAGDTDVTWSADKLDGEFTDVLTAIQGKYTKPSGGIPATDIADGVIPVVDSALSDSSENAVQNKVVKGALDMKAPVIINTATGNPAVFSDGGGMPLKSLLIPFTPVQSGTGDPSPQNIRSILPWNGLKVWNGGKNLLNPTNYVFNTITSRGLTFEVQTDGSVKVTGTTESSDFGPTLSVRFKLHAGTYCGYKDDGNVYVAYRKSTSEEGGVTTGLVSPFTLDGSEWVYCNIYVRNPGTFDTILHPQIARENTQTAYEPYHPITETDIVFPSPVYGGEHEAVSGRLMNEWAEIASYNGETLPGEWLSDRDVYQAGTTPTIGAQVVYKLDTPQEIQLTPQQITAIIGDNTIWSDADGLLTVAYPADTKTYISNLIATAIASL